MMNRRVLRVGALALALLVLMIAAVQLQLPYLASQGLGLLQDFLARTPSEQLRDNPNTSQEMLVFLERADAVLAYAHDSVGLADPGSYRHVVQSDRSAIAYVVSAAPELEFRHYRWHYPLMGSMPYRGYFNRTGAEREAERLRQRGYDTLVRGITAFSTLGYLPDPLYPFMARFPVHRLANTILHELAHATLWLPNEDHFNEQFATFVGDEGSRLFVAERYGKDSAEYALIQQSAADRYRFRGEMVTLRSMLAQLYEQGLPIETMRKRKQEIIDGYQLEFATRYGEDYYTEAYRHFSVQPVNNAYVILFQLYSDDIEIFYEVYATFGQSLPATVEFFLRFEDADEDPYVLMEKHLRQYALKERIESRVSGSEIETADDREMIRRVTPLL